MKLLIQYDNLMMTYVLLVAVMVLHSDNIKWLLCN